MTTVICPNTGVMCNLQPTIEWGGLKELVKNEYTICKNMDLMPEVISHSVKFHRKERFFHCKGNCKKESAKLVGETIIPNDLPARLERDINQEVKHETRGIFSPH